MVVAKRCWCWRLWCLAHQKAHEENNFQDSCRSKENETRRGWTGPTEERSMSKHDRQGILESKRRYWKCKASYECTPSTQFVSYAHPICQNFASDMLTSELLNMMKVSFQQSLIRASPALQTSEASHNHSSSSSSPTRHFTRNYDPPTLREVTELLTYLSYIFAHRYNSAASLCSLVNSFSGSADSLKWLRLTFDGWKRLPGALLSRYADIDTLREMCYEQRCCSWPLTTRRTVDESKWKLNHAIYDPAERIVEVTPRKPAGIRSLAYILASKLLYSEIPLLVVGLSLHADCNDATTFDLSNMLVVRLLRLHNHCYLCFMAILV